MQARVIIGRPYEPALVRRHGWQEAAHHPEASSRVERGHPRGAIVFDVGLSFLRLAAWLAVGTVSIGCSSSRSGTSGAPDSAAPPCTPSTCAGTCTAGECFVTLSTPTPAGNIYGAYDLVLGKTTLYWAEYSGGGVSILSVPAAGGSTVTLASSTDYPTGLAADTSHVFWASSSAFPDGGLIASVPASGGSQATIASGLPNPQAIATDGTNVYFTDSSPCASATCTGYVLSVPVGGGTVSTLASHPGVGAWIFSAHGQLYWTTQDGRVLTVPTSGGTPTELAYEVTGGLAVVADQAAAYWTNSGGDVMRLPLDGGKATVLALGQSPLPQALAVDETSVYWINQSTSYNSPGATAGVLKVPIGGGPVTAIPNPDGGAFQGLAIDDTSLYLLLQVDQSTSVLKVTPK